MFFTRLPPVGILEAVSTPPKHGKIKKAGSPKRVTSHPFRHSFATRLLADGYDILALQRTRPAAAVSGNIKDPLGGPVR